MSYALGQRAETESLRIDANLLSSGINLISEMVRNNKGKKLGQSSESTTLVKAILRVLVHPH